MTQTSYGLPMTPLVYADRQRRVARMKEWVPTNPEMARLRAMNAKVDLLREMGHTVEHMDIPGLFRIDGGPELTINQLLAIE